MNRFFFILLAVVFLGRTGIGTGIATQASAKSSGEVELEIDPGGGQAVLHLTRAALLQSPALMLVQVKNDPAYPNRMLIYHAIPFSKLVKTPFKGNVIFHCRDGFHATISAQALLDSQLGAYLAIEDPAKPWPSTGEHGRDSQTAGPFYLIWTHPDPAHVGREQWPFQVTAIQASSDQDQARLQKSDPEPHLKKDSLQRSTIRSGYQVYLKNCHACHSLNHDSANAIGPDLNSPENPTRYLQPAALRKLIREPKSVRTWPDQKMPGFAPDILSENELSQLVSYLEFMAAPR